MFILFSCYVLKSFIGEEVKSTGLDQKHHLGCVRSVPTFRVIVIIHIGQYYHKSVTYVEKALYMYKIF